MRVFILHILLALCFQLNAQEWQWARSFGKTNSNVLTSKIIQFSDEKVLVAGSYSDNSLNLGTTTHPNNGAMDAWLAIMDNKTGNIISSAAFGGSNGEYLQSAASDKEGNIYAVGFFRSIFMIIGNDTLLNKGNADAFIVKFDKNLNAIWAKSFGNSNEESINDINIDNEGNVYFALNIISATGTTFPAAFSTIKMSPHGEIVWIRNVLGNYELSANFTCIDGNNDILIAGRIDGEAFIPGYDTLEYSVFEKTFIIRYDSSGKYIDGTANAGIAKLSAIKCRDNYIYIAGEHPFNGQLSLLKLNDRFEKVWSSEITWLNTGSNSFYQFRDLTCDIGFDSDENIYLLSSFKNSGLIFNQDTIPSNYSPYGILYANFYVLQFDRDAQKLKVLETPKGNLTDMAYSMVVNGRDDFTVFGMQESDELTFGSISIENSSRADTFLTHGFNFYVSKRPIGFASRYNGNPSTSTLHSFHSNTILLYLYPNPTNNILHLQSEAFTGQPVQVQIFSADGRLVRQQNISGAMQTIQVQTGDLPPGIYIATTIINQQISSARFVKQ